MRTLVFVAVFVAGAASAAGASAQSSPPPPFCEIETSGRITGPSADICEQVARRWQALVATRAISGVIRIVDGTDGLSTVSAQRWVLEWPAPPPRRETRFGVRPDGFIAYEAENIIAHEAGHKLFRSYTIFFGAQSAREGYGSVVPDWFDECPAVWMESAAMRATRVRRIIGATPSLERLVTMSHPGTEAVGDNAINSVRRWQRRTVTPPCPQCTFLAESLRTSFRVVDIGKTVDGRPDTNVWYSATNPSNAETLEEREFYALSYMLLRFIHTRGGYAAVRELISRYREDPSPRVEVLIALPGLPPTLQTFEREWHAFLRDPPAEER